MNKVSSVVVLIVVFLALFIPLASSNPDGLEQVAETLGVDAHDPVWNGVTSDYSVAMIEDPYLSTFIAGVLGTLLVLLTTFLLGKVVTSQKTNTREQASQSLSFLV